MPGNFKKIKFHTEESFSREKSSKEYFLRTISGKNITEKELYNILEEMRRDLDDESPILYVSSQSSTLLDESKIDEIMKFIGDISHKYDLFYLSNFMDNCFNPTEIEDMVPDGIKNIKFYHSKSPNGMYALAATPKTWDKIYPMLNEMEEGTLTSKLSRLVSNGKLTAVSTWPRVYVPDVSKLENDLDNYYTYPCRFETIADDPREDIGEMSLYWFFVGSVFIIFFLLVLWRLN